MQRFLLVAACFLAALFSVRPLAAQSAAMPIPIDASQIWRAPGPAAYSASDAVSPAGRTIGLNSRFLTLDGKPWLPVSGEFHFSRVPRAQWEDELLKMKAAGVQIVSTYVIWIHHEEIRGQFDWTGQRDLRAFAQLCAKHGLFLIVRIGPWDHAEVRNGGLPDWVLQQGPTRENAPRYLAAVRAWYGQIGAELHGLMWKDGGPVLGIQLENEYARRGAGAGVAHILELKKIARASGLDVPLYLVTGWDNAVAPPQAVVPVYGGYPAAPWNGTTTKLPPAEVYAFRFASRDTAIANAGQTQREDSAANSNPASASLPWLTAELGSGIEDTYHRRPVIAPDDVAAMVPVLLGSGVNLYGTYMFQGGENPDGKLTTLQESQATGYPNDLPIKSYDFQAPLGAYGQERASLRKLKVFFYFLNDFGADLAPMSVHAPLRQPRDPADLAPPRAAVRSRGDSGFLFFNNYVRGAVLPPRRAVQFEIRLPGRPGKTHAGGKPASVTLAIPRHPVDLPSGSYFIWPFNLRLQGVTLRYATAQLFTRLDNNGVETVYFEAQPGIAPEFAFDAATVRSVTASSGESAARSGVVYLTGIRPGVESSIDLVSSAGKRLRLVVLREREAENAWKVRLGGGEHLLLTEEDFVADPAARPERIELRSIGSPRFQFTLTPPIAAPSSVARSGSNAAGTHDANLLGWSGPNRIALDRVAATDRAETFVAQSPERHPALDQRQIRPAGDAPPVRLGPAQSWRPHGVAEAPGPGAMPQAAQWSIGLPPGALDGLAELFLDLRYEGDVARLTDGGRLLDDNFWNGQPWRIGLARFLAPDGAGRFHLSILPLRKDAPVYFELAAPPQFDANGQIARMVSLRLVPEYRLAIGLAAH